MRWLGDVFELEFICANQNLYVVPFFCITNNTLKPNTLYNTMDTNSIVSVYKHNIMIEFYVYNNVEQFFPIFSITPVVQCCVMKTLQIFTSYTNTIVEKQPKISMSSITKFTGFGFTFLILQTSPRSPNLHCFLPLFS